MKSSLLLIAALTLLLSPTSQARVVKKAVPPAGIQQNELSGVREKLRNIKNYALFYGKADDATMQALARYDMVIIDTQALGGNVAERIRFLKERNTIVIGYLSCFELASWHRYKDRVPEAWRIQLEPGKNWKPWGQNDAIDLGVAEWRSLLTELVQSEVLSYGCDGVFMDTIADLDNPALTGENQRRQLEGLDALLAGFRKAYPDTIFVGNWTIQKTLPVVASHADAICWEDFKIAHFENPENASWMQSIRKKLQAAQKENKLCILTLWEDPNKSEADQEKTAALARSFGFIPYTVSGSYQTAPR